MKRKPIVVLAAALTAALTSCGSDSSARVCHETILAQLKSPGSAKFVTTKTFTVPGKPDVGDGDTPGFVAGTKPSVEVVGSVNSQNVYGALIRSDYTCKVVHAEVVHYSVGVFHDF